MRALSACFSAELHMKNLNLFSRNQKKDLSLKISLIIKSFKNEFDHNFQIQL